MRPSRDVSVSQKLAHDAGSTAGVAKFRRKIC